MQSRESGVAPASDAQPGGQLGIAYPSCSTTFPNPRAAASCASATNIVPRGRLWLQPHAMLGLRDANLEQLLLRRAAGERRRCGRPIP